MKRLITCLFGFALLCSVGFAKDFNNGISNGGFWVLDGNLGEGYGEWSFPILKTKNNFMIRDNVTIGGFGGASGNSMTICGFTVGDRLLFGGIYDDTGIFAVKAYGFAGVDFEMFGTKTHPLFSPSVRLGSTFGGGFEFQYTERNSFVVEYGGKYRYVIGKNMASYKEYNCINPVLMLGFRSYLENRN